MVVVITTLILVVIATVMKVVYMYVATLMVVVIHVATLIQQSFTKNPPLLPPTCPQYSTPIEYWFSFFVHAATQQHTDTHNQIETQRTGGGGGGGGGGRRLQIACMPTCNCFDTSRRLSTETFTFRSHLWPIQTSSEHVT